MILDRYRVVQGLVRSPEVVLDKPLGETPIETGAVCSHIPHLDEFLFERPIEPFLEGVVRRGLGTGEILGDAQRGGSGTEPLCEFAPIVGLEMFHLSLA